MGGRRYGVFRRDRATDPGERRTERLLIRLSIEEAELIRDAATKRRVAVGKFLRDAALAAADGVDERRRG